MCYSHSKVMASICVVIFLSSHVTNTSRVFGVALHAERIAADNLQIAKAHNRSEDIVKYGSVRVMLLKTQIRSDGKENHTN